jgi:hypothetical protein
MCTGVEESTRAAPMESGAEKPARDYAAIRGRVSVMTDGAQHFGGARKTIGDVRLMAESAAWM